MQPQKGPSQAFPIERETFYFIETYEKLFPVRSRFSTWNIGSWSVAAVKSSSLQLRRTLQYTTFSVHWKKMC